MLFQEQIKFIESFEDLVFQELRRTINAFGYEIEEFIREDQLFDRGVDGNNEPLKDQRTGRLGYTRTTIRLKLAKGQPADRITLRDENDFHPSITVEGFPDRFEVSSNVNHARFLIKRYTDEILRPTVQNMTKFFDDRFIPNLKRRVNDEFTR